MHGALSGAAQLLPRHAVAAEASAVAASHPWQVTWTGQPMEEVMMALEPAVPGVGMGKWASICWQAALLCLSQVCCPRQSLPLRKNLAHGWCLLSHPHFRHPHLMTGEHLVA